MYTMLSGKWVTTFIFCPEDGSSSLFETSVTIYHSAWSHNLPQPKASLPYKPQISYNYPYIFAVS